MTRLDPVENPDALAAGTAHELTAEDRSALLDAATQCILLHDAATKDILWANPAACAMLEFTLDELRPLKAPDMSSQARQYRRSVGRAWLQEAVERGHSRTEWRYRSKSGREFPTDARGTRVELSSGPAVMVQFRNIEREQELERTLLRTTDLVEALGRRTVTGALVVRADTTVEFATDSALAQLGATRDELVGASLLDFGDLVDDGGRVSWDAVITGDSSVTSVRIHARRPEDARRWLEASVERITAVDGADGVMLIVHDVTSRVEAAVQRERDVHRENYLARYNAMGDMAVAIAHELAQPLSAASNYLDGITGRLPTHEDGGDVLTFGLAGARRQIERARRIVSSLRGFVGHLEQVEQVADLNAIVEECLYFIEIRARAAAVRLEVDLDPEPVPIRCERVLTGQVVVNLCFNAVDEMAFADPADRVVRIRTGRDRGMGAFAVEDRGRGVPDQSYDQVFESASTSKAEGSGLGLGLSYRIITRQHGTISAAPARPRGSVFSFALPLVDPAVG